MSNEEYVESHLVFPDVEGAYELDVPYRVLVTPDGTGRKVERLTRQEVIRERAIRELPVWTGPVDDEGGE